jgi:hypothetical protein
MQESASDMFAELRVICCGGNLVPLTAMKTKNKSST